MTLYRGTFVKALNEQLSGVKLTELTASDVQRALTALAARSSTRTVQIAHNVLVRAIRRATLPAASATASAACSAADMIAPPGDLPASSSTAARS